MPVLDLSSPHYWSQLCKKQPLGTIFKQLYACFLHNAVQLLISLYINADEKKSELHKYYVNVIDIFKVTEQNDLSIILKLCVATLTKIYAQNQKTFFIRLGKIKLLYTQLKS